MNKLQADEPILHLGGVTVGDFWAWAYSDILSNVNRSAFAEFLVGAALGITDRPRTPEWHGYDLDYRGKRIEVKASAYVQSWPQSRPSTIRFDIAAKKAWDAVTNQFIAEPARVADCYVFALYTEQDRSKANVLDVSRWEFYVVETEILNDRFTRQESIGLAALRTLATPVSHADLRDTLEKTLWR